MAREPKYDIPEDLRRAAAEFNRLSRAGEPIPEEVRRKRNEYRRLLSRERGVKPRLDKYPGMPRDLREAASEAARLRKAGEPVPDGTRAKASEYQRLLAREKDPAVGTRRVKHPGIPSELREADRECAKLRGEGKPVPDEARRKRNEYRRRLARERGVRPRRDTHPGMPRDLREAASEAARLRRAGEPIPGETREKEREYKRRLARERGVRPREIKHPGIPDGPREAHAECARLRRRGERIPDGVRAGDSEYRRACRRERRKRKAGSGAR